MSAKEVYLSMLRSAVERDELCRKAAAEAVAADPLYFFSWGCNVSWCNDATKKERGNVIFSALEASIARDLLAADAEGHLIESVTLLRESFLREQLRFSGGTSSSAFHNAVESVKAEFRCQMLDGMGFLGEPALRSLMEE